MTTLRINTLLRSIALLLAGIGSVTHAAASKDMNAAPPPADLASLKTALNAILQETKTPGMSVALVTRDEILWADGLGLADVEKKIPATADTLFRIGSTSKAFVALAALKLRAEGKLDLEATLASVAPEIQFHNPWEATHPVRIVHLLEHTAGFDDIHLRDYANPDSRPDNLKDALAYDPDSRTSRWPPGTRFAYCNAGPPIVAYVIEKLTGQPFADYIAQNFFSPIGMKTAGYFPTPESEARLTQLYAADGTTAYPYWRISMWPSGSINASAHDMAHYLRFYLNRGRVGDQALVSEPDLERMEKPATTLAARAGLSTGYGLYNATSFDDDGRLYHGHGGGVQGGASQMVYLPEAGIGYAFMVNATNGNATMRITKAIRAYLTRDLAKPVFPPAVPIADDIAARYAGFYVPTNPRVQLAAIAERIGGVSRLSFSDGAARFGSVLSPDAKRYVGVSERLLRREDRSAATLALLEPTDEGLAIATDYTSFRQVPALVALGPLALLAVAMLLMVSTVLFVPIWGVRALRGRIALRPHLGVRVWPLAGSLAMLAFLGGLMLMALDREIFQHYSAVTVRSAALVLASVLAVLVPLAGLAALLHRRYRDAHRGLYWHAVLVLAATALFALYLLGAGAVPFVTWT